MRQRDPSRLAFFTGRDQSQALTGWFAQQYGTQNFAAHGGFCSVNMAAAGLYTFGGSFWEFGEPDWEHTRYFLMFGVAEDHGSNPIKTALGKLKAKGVKFVAVNPVRTGYGAIADEWIGIRPGTDGLFVGSLIHELMKAEKIDLDYLVRYTNSPWLVIDAPGSADDGLFARDENGKPLAFDRKSGDDRRCVTRRHLARADGDIQTRRRPQRTAGLRADRGALSRRHLFARRQPPRQPACRRKPSGASRASLRTPRSSSRSRSTFRGPTGPGAGMTRPSAARSRCMRCAASLRTRTASRPAACFTCLQILLGSIDCPGGFRYKAPFPRPAPPANRPARPSGPDMPLKGAPLGFPQGPEDLLVDANGKPQRIDKAYSWDAPIAAHGLMHMVITNAAKGDPYPVDVLFMFMANMSWNSSMNIPAVLKHLTETDPTTGEYKIPKIIYSDAYSSEMIAYADLILPDTTYLERWDCISLLDRPISGPDGPADAIRQPVVQPDRDVRGFQTVLLDIGARLKLPGFVTDDGKPRYPGGYADYIVNHERAPGIGSLAGIPRRRRQKLRARRAQSQAARCLHRGRLLPPPSSDAGAELLQARQPGVSRLGEAGRLHRRCQAGGVPALS